MLLFNISSFHSILEVYITILKIQHADVMCCKGAPYSGLRLFFSSLIFYNTLRLLYISQPVLLYIFISQANEHLGFLFHMQLCLAPYFAVSKRSHALCSNCCLNVCEQKKSIVLSVVSETGFAIVCLSFCTTFNTTYCI